MKKLIVMLLTVALCFSMAVPAMAATRINTAEEAAAAMPFWSYSTLVNEEISIYDENGNVVRSYSGYYPVRNDHTFATRNDSDGYALRLMAQWYKKDEQGRYLEDAYEALFFNEEKGKFESYHAELLWNIPSGTAVIWNFTDMESKKSEYSDADLCVLTIELVCEELSGTWTMQKAYKVVDRTAIPVTGVSLNESTLTLKKGDTAVLEATVEPSNATNTDLSWFTDDTSVATVNNGVVTAVGTGETEITVVTKRGAYSASCTVTVVEDTEVPPEEIPVTGVSLNKSELSLEEGDTAVLEATVEPANATNTELVWRSEDTSVATVSNGTVKAVGAGEAVITVTTEDGGFTASCTVTVKEKEAVEWNPDYTRPSTPPTFADKPFADISGSDYFYPAVHWAAKHHVTQGTSATTFSPDLACNRAQMITFLWRAAGCPKAAGSACAFTDVKAGAYYYDALLWAVESGITQGTSATTFSPEQTVSRGQVAAFLWRYAGSVRTDMENPFLDVSEDAYYHDAVLWAYANSITDGVTGTAFAPDAPCTRAQIVTFLWRLFD